MNGMLLVGVLFLGVAMGLVIGAHLEAHAWHRRVARSLARLARRVAAMTASALACEIFGRRGPEALADGLELLAEERLGR